VTPRDQEILDELIEELKEETGAERKSIMVFLCGRNDCNHEWGEEPVDMGNGVLSLVCVKCDTSAMDDFMRRAK
jgi:hypothetical protein